MPLNPTAVPSFTVPDPAPGAASDERVRGGVTAAGAVR